MLRFYEQHLLAVCGNKPALGLNYDNFTTLGGDVEIRRVSGLALRHGIRELVLFILERDAFARQEIVYWSMTCRKESSSARLV